uniref:Uncharacterized protein n=2 Tax=Hemiselmis andersenii TaxID=464988 RepID=A0A6U4IX20_HEMAN|mmetsp:Transcript_47005/g.114239  ORF Transcript_47005/g.114239 Transcript_47005/m.114239 type:complete len:169 (+) Transcript_47005:193-699(+)
MTDIKALVQLLESDQNPENRKDTVCKLFDALNPASEKYEGKEAEQAFIEVGGLGVVRTRIDSMEGDWMQDARLGTTDRLDQLARFPALQATFDKVSEIKETKVAAAVAALHEKSHGHAHSHGEDGSCGHGHSHGGQVGDVDLTDLHEELKGVRVGEEAQGGGGSEGTK